MGRHGKEEDSGAMSCGTAEGCRESAAVQTAASRRKMESSLPDRVRSVAGEGTAAPNSVVGKGHIAGLLDQTNGEKPAEMGDSE